MGILKTLVRASAHKSVIKTIGEVTATTAESILESAERHKMGAPTMAQQYLRAPEYSKCIGENYKTVQSAFEAYGFTNIELSAKKLFVMECW